MIHTPIANFDDRVPPFLLSPRSTDLQPRKAVHELGTHEEHISQEGDGSGNASPSASSPLHTHVHTHAKPLLFGNLRLHLSAVFILANRREDRSNARLGKRVHLKAKQNKILESLKCNTITCWGNLVTIWQTPFCYSLSRRISQFLIPAWKLQGRGTAQKCIQKI